MSKSILPADKSIHKPWTVGEDDLTRGNIFWAIASGRIPRNIAAQLRWDHGCWVFAGCTNKDGYGRAGVGGRIHCVHRLVYEAVFGAIPDGHDLHHERCERKCCCDPRHVVAMPHGSHSRLTRIASGAQLSIETAQDIRERYAAGDITLSALAALHGVSKSAIWYAVSGRTWKGVA